jgi:hypothetical protein
MTNPNDPAFPQEAKRFNDPESFGLTKREYFAAMITAAMCSPTSNGCFDHRDAPQIIPNAIALADYLIAALSKEEGTR